MPRFVLKKLVRDKIVDFQLARGQRPDYRALGEEEYIVELAKKLAEEAQEIPSASKDKVIEEIADVQQAIDDLIERLGISSADLAAVQAVKSERNGSFKKGLYIDTIDLDDDDEWVKYYREEPGRFPEV